MYAKGMTTRQISDTIEDIYGFDVSEGFISDVTDKLLPQIEEWQNRPVYEAYPVIYIDAIHFVYYVRRPITWLKTFKTQKKIASFLYGKTGLKFYTW